MREIVEHSLIFSIISRGAGLRCNFQITLKTLHLFMISLYLKKKQLTKVKVIGIEPDEEKVSFIQDIIQLNHINNIQLTYYYFTKKNFICNCKLTV